MQVDKTRIGQVITNLTENAIKFSQENSLITVGAILKDKEVIKSVKDNGTGMPAEVVVNLFNRLFFASRNSALLQNIFPGAGGEN